MLGVPALGSSDAAHHAVPTACAIRALLLELLPFVGEAPCPSSITFSEDELHRKILALLQLLPPNLLGLKVDAGGTRAAHGTWRRLCGSLPTPFSLQPCQPLDCQSQDVLDKLTLCGLLEAEEVGVLQSWLGREQGTAARIHCSLDWEVSLSRGEGMRTCSASAKLRSAGG